ncbi:MAG: PDZ domain-containing protein [Phycisphaerales bacterium]|nr:PDZ domain-containing protein [Phycisphaerales bacterium]
MPRNFVILLLLAALGRLGPIAAGKPELRYTLVLDRPQTQTLRVLMEIDRASGPEVSVQLPAWRPGRYLILDPASEVRWLVARTADGRELPSSKTDKSTWVIQTGAAEGAATDLSIEYEIYANELSLRTRHVDASHAFINGATVFMLFPPRRQEPLTLRVQAPAGWQVSCGLQAAEDGLLLAPDYDMLVDSPLEIGRHARLQFQVAGVPHEIAVWGEGRWDAERLRRDFADIVREQASIFGDLPYDNYVFLLHVQPGIGGGTEHYNSTILQTRPSSFDTPDAYRDFLGLVSHEFFHTWNVKRFRPAGIHRYDYSNENYTRSLWVAEGTTSYYDDLTLARVGLIDIREYMKRLGSSIEGLRSRPGERVQSLEDSSFDAWIKFNRPGPDRDNTTVSFYGKGALASLVLDMELRRSTGNARSLDDVMRTLYQRFPLGGPGFTPEDLVSIASQIAGTDMGPVFAAHVRGTEPLPLEEALATVGLELFREPVKDSWDDEEGRRPREQRGYLGLSVVAGSAGARVRSALEDGPAFEAGIIADDEIIAVDGRRVDADSFSRLERDLEPGQRVELALFRRERLMTFSFKTAAKPNATWSVRLVAQPSPDQIAAFEKWMDRPWPGESGDDASDEDEG